MGSCNSSWIQALKRRPWKGMLCMTRHIPTPFIPPSHSQLRRVQTGQTRKS